MDMDTVSLEHVKRGQNRFDRIFDLLYRIKDSYVPPLQEVVDLEDYCKKISKFADIVIANNGARDIGLLAIYTNGAAGPFAFVSSIGIEPAFMGSGISGQLLNQAKTLTKCKGLPEIRLKVDARNERAIRFYRRHGFIFCERNSKGKRETSRLMKCTVTK
jgi:ribosomal protein S18 acetylase RimI-like enzyme